MNIALIKFAKVMDKKKDKKKEETFLKVKLV